MCVFFRTVATVRVQSYCDLNTVFIYREAHFIHLGHDTDILIYTNSVLYSTKYYVKLSTDNTVYSTL